MAKISKTKIDAMISNHKLPTKQIEVNAGASNVTIEVNPNISFANMIDAARELAGMQFAVDKKTGKEFYAPYLTEMAEWYVMLKYFTNIDVAIPDDADDPNMKVYERLWRLRFCPEINNQIFSAVGSVWDAIADAAMEMIDDRRERLKPGALAFWGKLDELLDVIKQRFEAVPEEDWKALIEGIGKLEGIDDNNIIEFLKSASE